MDLTQDRYKWQALVSTLMNINVLLAISDFRHEVNENFDILGYYAASSGNFLPKFQDDLSVPSSFSTLEYRTERLPQTFVRNYHYSLRNKPEERSSQPSGSIK
jgi:hypothetical protein